MWRWIPFTLLLFLPFFHGCFSKPSSPPFKIGVDPSWYPVEFGLQQPFVNGFVEDLLLEMTRLEGQTFERIESSSENLFEELQKGSFDAILSTLPPHAMFQTKYDFSDPFLTLGPVLIVPTHSPYGKLSDLEEELVGWIAPDPALLVLQKYPNILIRNYPSAPALLDALASGEIEGALLNALPAHSYLKNLYEGKLKVVSEPLDTSGLRLITLKDSHPKQLHLFNQSLQKLTKTHHLQALLQKWQLL